MQKIRLFLLTLIVVAITSCGGGTSGTGGTTISYQGVVTDSAGHGIEAASVTIAETGDSTKTESNGSFSINSEAGLPTITLVIEGPNFSQTVPVQITDQSDAAAIVVSVGTKDQSSNSYGADIRVKVVGSCDVYFENTRPIRQANKSRDNQECTIRVTMRSRRGGLSNRQYALQVSSCDDTAEPVWKSVLTGITNDIGVGFSKFTFTDSKRSCLYRVLVPLNDTSIPALEFPIQTLTYQSKTAL